MDSKQIFVCWNQGRYSSVLFGKVDTGEKPVESYTKNSKMMLKGCQLDLRIADIFLIHFSLALHFICRNQPFDLHCKSNNWFLYRMQDRLKWVNLSQWQSLWDNTCSNSAIKMLNFYRRCLIVLVEFKQVG